MNASGLVLTSDNNSYRSCRGDQVLKSKQVIATNYIHVVETCQDKNRQKHCLRAGRDDSI